jgi:hypothetical protein
VRGGCGVSDMCGVSGVRSGPGEFAGIQTEVWCYDGGDACEFDAGDKVIFSGAR